MRSQLIENRTDKVTSFGHAGPGCIQPPEVEYRTHELAIVQIFERGDSFEEFGWNPDEEREALKEYPGTVEWTEWYIITLREQLMEPHPIIRIEWQQGDIGAIVRYCIVTENEPCGRAAGVWEK